MTAADLDGVLPMARQARPNLLFIFSDEHRACSLSGEPYCEVHTDHLNRLARDGITFRNCISNYPLCSPYRATLLSGRWPLETGVIDNALRLDDEEFSLGKAFSLVGYDTGYIGKWHLARRGEDGKFIPEGPGRHGFGDWQVWANTRRHFGASTFDPHSGAKVWREGYSCSLMTDAALKFIGMHTDKPWMLVMSWVPPHPPFDQAPPDAMRLYDAGALEFRPNVATESPSELRTYLRGYYAHISALDRELGRVLDKLDETGHAANTIIVYTSDHGTMLGSQGWGGKRLPFDEACRVPFVLRYPGTVPANCSSDLLMGTIDIFPSLCGLAGVPVPKHCGGRDLSDAMRGRAVSPPESAFLMHVARTNADLEGGGRIAPLFRGVRTDRFTYAIADDGRWCLYDDREDPYQLRNLIGEPTHAKTAGELDGLLSDWLKQTRDSFPLAAIRHRRSAHCIADVSS